MDGVANGESSTGRDAETRSNVAPDNFGTVLVSGHSRNDTRPAVNGKGRSGRVRGMGRGRGLDWRHHLRTWRQTGSNEATQTTHSFKLLYTAAHPL